ncbi:MAG: 5-(carboxyamino)imidazole ribonucleotide synthase [Neisseriaceae bacterium]
MKESKFNGLCLPPSRIGIIGGGQLGMMLAMTAKIQGYQVVVVDPQIGAPAKKYADEVIDQPYTATESLLALSTCKAVTVEFENVDISLMQRLEDRVSVVPSSASVSVMQHRLREKQMIQHTGLNTVPYQFIDSIESCCNVKTELFPAILKTATLGYDGKGQISVDKLAHLKQAFLDLKGVPCILEKRLPLLSEASVVVCRLNTDQVRCFPVADNVHRGGILLTSTVPSALSRKQQELLQTQAIHLANALGYVGVLGVEFFIVDDEQEIYVNELAPRPHNSGHYTLDATVTTQFQQQLRLMCGLPPEETSLLTACTMLNLLGDLWHDDKEPDWGVVLQEQGVHLHLYGKSIPRPGRKMGHINVLGSSRDDSLGRAHSILRELEVKHVSARN